MLNAEHTLTTVIEQLERLNLDRAATLDDLVVLNAARESIDELFRSCTADLQDDPNLAPVLSAIASAVTLTSKRAAGTVGRPRKAAVIISTDPNKRANDLVVMFWKTFAGSFVWDFLPAEFLHLLYVHWMSTQFPRDAALSRFTFARRLRAAVHASGDWFYVRSRPGSLMDAVEPLEALVPEWNNVRSDDARHGLRRSGV